MNVAFACDMYGYWNWGEIIINNTREGGMEEEVQQREGYRVKAT